jgi:membrane associated rhomboid family serine protease
MAYLALLVIAGYAVYVMKPEERAKLLGKAVAMAREVKGRADEARLAPEPFRDALRQRTPWVLATPAIIFLQVTVFVLMLLSPGAMSDQDTLISWGGNIGIRTTNGEWWRLVTSTFVHAGFLQLLISVAGLAQAGILAERLTGPITVALVYLAAGVLASLESLSSHSVVVGFGSSSAILGVYGLLLACLLWDTLARRSSARGPQTLFESDESSAAGEPIDGAEPIDLGEPTPLPRVPLATLKALAPAAGIFLLWCLADGFDSSKLSGLMAGLVCGLALASNVTLEKPSIFRLAGAVAALVAIVAVSAFPLRGLTDARPEIARVVALEDRTTVTYQKAVDQFKLGRLSADALARQIDQTITPELKAASARLKTLGKVPAEHAPMVKDAEEYLRLRDESWRMRAAALHKSNMPALRQADKTERASLEAFERIKPVEQK